MFSNRKRSPPHFFRLWDHKSSYSNLKFDKYKIRDLILNHNLFSSDKISGIEALGNGIETGFSDSEQTERINTQYYNPKWVYVEFFGSAIYIYKISAVFWNLVQSGPRFQMLISSKFQTPNPI